MDLTKKGDAKFLINYRDHWLELSNGTIMRTGVCQNCKELLISGKKVKQTADKILEKHKAFWKSDPYEIETLLDVEIVNPNADEDAFLSKRAKKNLDDRLKLQAQKDNFEANHEGEIARLDKEEKKAAAELKKRQKAIEVLMLEREAELIAKAEQDQAHWDEFNLFNEKNKKKIKKSKGDVNTNL